MTNEVNKVATEMILTKQVILHAKEKDARNIEGDGHLLISLLK